MCDTNREELATVRMLEKAERLFQDGYRAEEILGDLYRVTSPDGAQYVVDRRDWTCTCPAFRRGMYVDSQNRTTCKHMVGTRLLLADQQREAERRRFVAWCADRVDYVDGRTETLARVTA